MHQNRKLEQHKTTTKQVTRAEEYQGVIPSSTEFAGYENTLRGAADRILKLAEKQQDHIIDVQNKALADDVKRRDMGHEYNMTKLKKHYNNDNLRIFAAIVVCLTILGIGTYTISLGYPDYGTGMIGIVIVGVITAFFKRDTKNKEE